MTAAADVIVVGSGASASSAAFPLVANGLSVLMLDVGNAGTRYAGLVPDAPFAELRRTDPGQHRYFLGDDFEGLPFGRVRVGAQLTPPRQFIVEDVEELAPTRAGDFSAFQSFALGGLAAGWGAVANEFLDADLEGYPIRHRDLKPHYDAVARRIGIAGRRDDLLPYYGDCTELQPPLAIDAGAECCLAAYERRREALNRAGLHAGLPRLAVLSRDLGARRGQSYHDMDFYADSGHSVFRPAFAVEELRAQSRFTYLAPRLVESFRELADGNGVEVTAVNPRSGREEVFRARRLVLAAGTFGTIRIVLRSLGRYDTPVPFVANPYRYAVCVNLAMLGKPGKDRRHSLSQLGLVYDPERSGKPLIDAQTFSYRSLLLFKVAKESPLAVPESLRILRDVQSAFVIIGINHEDRPAPGKRCLLRRGTAGKRDTLEVEHAVEPAEKRRQRRAEKAFLRLLRKLGCWPLRRIDPGEGSSIHYGGTLPMTVEDRELTADPVCRLRGTRSVYVADGSVLPFLPAKSLTFTLMANAERVGAAVAADLEG
jgi:choline dehydrogenase-like flavoprotein